MSADSDGGPAFPMQDMQAIHAYASAKVAGISDTDERDRAYTQARSDAVGGMTLRDYLAAKALPGLIAARVSLDDEDEECFANINACGWGAELVDLTTYAESVAQDAYFIADAMLKERSK